MADVGRLVDVGDNKTVSNCATPPLSPDGSSLLGTPISLDFDPMSFQLRDPSPTSSPTAEPAHNGDGTAFKMPNNNVQISNGNLSDDLDFFDPLRTVSDEVSDQHLMYRPPSSNGKSDDVFLRDMEVVVEGVPNGYLVDDHQDLPVMAQAGDQNGDDGDDKQAVEQEHMVTTFPDNILLTNALSTPLPLSDCGESSREEAVSPLLEFHSPEPDLLGDQLNISPTPNHNISPVETEPPVVEVTSEPHLLVIDDWPPSEVVHDDDDVFVQHAEDASDESEADDSKSLKKENQKKAKKKSTLSASLDESKSKVSKTSTTTVQKEIKEERTVVTKVEKVSTNYHTEVNGVNNRCKTPSSEEASSADESESELTKESHPQEVTVCVTKLNTDVVNSENHIDCYSWQPSSNKGEDAIGINLKSLMNQYVHQTKQENALGSPKEIISTGVNIKMLKSSFSRNSEDLKPKGHEVIATGVSVRSLKNSFSHSDEEANENHVEPQQDGIKPSVDRSKVTRKFSQETLNSKYGLVDEQECNSKDDHSLCKICGKHVYQMEKVKAEKNIFHRTCFRCKECGKSLTVDAYSSHEGEIFCKAHFKQLFQPKARFDGEDAAPITPVSPIEADQPTDDTETDEGRQRRNEMVIRENVPEELPPDVVRSDTKPDYGLDALPNVNLSNIKSRFESSQESQLRSTADRSALQRSQSILLRMAKYQSAVAGDSHENGEMSHSSESDDEGENGVIRETKKKEKVIFSGMSNLKSQWETGAVGSPKEEKEEEKKEELAKLRQRICLGRSESMRAVYEKACQDSSKPASKGEPSDIESGVCAVSIKEKFEKGEVLTEEEKEKLEKMQKEKEEDLSVFSETAGIAGEAKTFFKQIDATTVQSPALTPTSPMKSPKSEARHTREVLYSTSSPVSPEDIVKCSEPTAKDDIPVETTAVSERFKFFQNYKEDTKERKRFQITPPREDEKEDSPEMEIIRDPNIVRSTDMVDDIRTTDTARKMLDKFKALESVADQPVIPSGPRPLKRITPPREYKPDDEAHEPSPEPERDPNIVRSSYKTEDDIVVETDMAKSLRAKFEKWDSDVNMENKKNEYDDDYLPQIDTTKNLRAKFEAIKDENVRVAEKPKPKVSRFVEMSSNNNSEACSICGKRLYPMEKMEASGLRFHKNCFRCNHCSTTLRLENYTTSGGKLYCNPHFKQLFITKGNYDEGFGREQHKEKWNRSRPSTPILEPTDNGHCEENYKNGDCSLEDECKVDYQHEIQAPLEQEVVN